MPIQVRGKLYPDIIFPDFSTRFPLMYSLNSSGLLSYPAPALRDSTLRLTSGPAIIEGTNLTTVQLLDTSTSWWLTMQAVNIGGFMDEIAVTYTGALSQRTYGCDFTADAKGTGVVTKDTITCRTQGGEVPDR